jgi:hypothetical protein
LALLGLIILGAPAVAAAEETVRIKKFTAKAVPIKGLKGTGNFYGKGAAVETEYEFEGSGYGPNPKKPEGGIPPLSGVNFFLPKGTKLDYKDFKTLCTEAILNNSGPEGCPKKSFASEVGSAEGEVFFGETQVTENATLQGFFGPGNSLLFYTHGATPVDLSIVSTGKYVTSSGKYSYEFKAKVPPVVSLQDAPLASVKKIHVKVGAGFKKGKKIISYGTLPIKGKCPKGGFPIKTEVLFGGEPEFHIPLKTVTAEFKAPCPKH